MKRKVIYGLTFMAAVVLAAMLAVGCGEAKAIADDVGFAVKAYCGLPEAARKINRVLIDEATRPNQVRIECSA